jgi:protein phosphatase
MLTVASLTHPGNVRDNNEDAVLWDPGTGLLAVADGMGGHNAGEVASRLAIDVLSEHLRTTSGTADGEWSFGFDPALSRTANRLLTAVKLANRAVFTAAAERSEYEGMGTTLTAALVEGSRLIFTSVGDSRLYVLDNRQLRQLTRDDSWLETLAESSGLDRTAAERHPMAHLLTSVVGPRADIHPSVQEADLADAQTLLLCTDGMYRKVPQALVRTILTEMPGVEQAAHQLVRTALEWDGRDNVTVIVARYARS